MAQPSRFYLGRVIKLGSMTADLLIRIIFDPPTISLRGTRYTFISAQDITTDDGRHAVFAMLAKYRPDGEVAVVDPSKHVLKQASVQDLLRATSSFVYVPSLSGIAYRHLGGVLSHELFERMFSDLVSQSGYQVDGFALERDRGDLFLVISDFRSGRELQTLNAAQIDTLFDRVRRFCELAISPSFIQAIDETSPSFQAAWPIYANRGDIKRIRVIAFSNARLSTRRKPEMTGEVLGVPFVCSVLDFVRYASILSAKGGFEPIEIDVTSVNGAPLPCLTRPL